MVPLFVTHLDTIGPHLQIYGQLDRKHMEVVQSNIDVLLTQGKYGEQTNVQVGNICLARRFDKFSRARIIATDAMNYVTVNFIDYGDNQTLHIQELRLMKLPTILEKFAKQSNSFILTGIFCDWKPYQLQEISQEIIGSVVDMRVEMEIYDFIFVRVYYARQDFSEYLLKQKRIGVPIDLEKLKETFCHIMENQRKFKLQTKPIYNNNNIKETSKGVIPVKTTNMNIGYYPVAPAVATVPVPVAVVPSRPAVPRTNYPPIPQSYPGPQDRNYRLPYNIPGNTASTYSEQPQEPVTQFSPKRSVSTFKSNTLMVGLMYDIYCCYVENGPCSFSVHLKSTEDDLNEMMSELENVPLKNLTDRPSLGMACIARFSEDGQLYRAVIMSIKPTSCQVAYVDYGNTEIVSFHDLYEIPSNFLDQKIFAVRFALSGYKELEPIDDCIKNTFKEMVLHRNLKLKVMPLEGPPLVQYCEVYDGQLNILEALKTQKNKKLRYSSSEILHANDVVMICYVESPKKFFVQKVYNIQAFEQMMDDLFLFCKKTKNSLSNLSKGTACAVKFENAWYRAEIIGQSGNRVSIRHVDFGNERKVDPNQLCSLTERLVQFPPQAIQCCLKGFENADTLSESATVQLEMLAESDDGDRRHFKCQIFKIEQNGSVLVNLIDESMRPELNLMKKLYKLSMPFNKYIGLEKEESAGYEGNLPSKNITQKSSPGAHALNSTSINESVSTQAKHFHAQQQSSLSDWDSGTGLAQPTSDWEGGSTGSTETRGTRNSGSGGEHGGRSPRRPQQNQKSFRENNRREQNYSTFKGKNLPPRFQKQQNENRRYRDNNNMNNSFEKGRNTNGESSSNRYNQSRSPRESNRRQQQQQSYPEPQQQEQFLVECSEDWGTEVGTGPVTTNIEDWSSSGSVVTPKTQEEYVSPDTSFPRDPLELTLRSEAVICWWISPHQFYTHLKSRTAEFEKMMKQMQTFYKSKSPISSLLSVGSSVIARYRDDNVLYRAKIIACNQSLRKYRVEFVDFGNQSTASENDIYSVEKRFIELPVMSYLCAFENVISNYDHNYITTKVEEYIKQGTGVICEYYKKENDVYYVTVEINGQSLKELMVLDGLLAALDTDTKIEMLIGQQIKAKIISIQDLLTFKIQIEGSNLDLLCSYNDIKFIKSNPQLSLEFKKSYEGVTCIVDVLDVTGEKILMLQPHIALFTNELPIKICDYPIIYQTLTVKVVYVHSTNKIFIQPVLVENIAVQLLDDMCSYYEENGKPLTVFKPGTICAANSEDDSWYRARIISETNDKSIEVFYIDYGNTELIDSKDKFKILEETFYESSALAVGVYLPLKSITDKEETVINEIQSLTDGYELTLQILERYKSCWIADISSSGYSLINVLEDKSLIHGRDVEFVKNIIDNEIPAVTIVEQQNEHTTQQLNEFQISENNAAAQTSSTTATNTITLTQEERTKNMIPAYLSHCDNPGRFFLHSVSDFDELTKLQDNIQIVAGSLPPLMRIVTGAPCIALYSVDDTWYRAKIIDNEIMAVQFIDYGNTDVVTDSSWIKEMHEAFAIIKPFAIPSSLAVGPKGTIDWVDEANTIFNESYEKTVYFEYITKSDKKNFIDLIIDEQNVAEKLISDGLARQFEIVKSGENCFVSHINNLSDFYIQMESDADALELIAGHLSGCENFPIIKDYVKGTICAAIFPDDSEWYRAKILSNTSEGVEVLFIDYGNTSITTEIRQITEDIAQLPPLTKKCSLHMPENILGWSDTAEARFSELSAMGQTVFVVQLIEPGDHAIVDLLVDGSNIIKELELLCDKRPNIIMDSSIISEKGRLSSVNEPDLRNATISHINSPVDFYVQFTANADQLELITDFLNGDREFERLDNPQKDLICSAVFPDDGALYRAKVLSVTDEGFSVLFTDFGNDAISTELYRLPDDLKAMPSMATHCVLENPSSKLDFTSDIANEKFTAIMDSFCSETVQCEIVNQVMDPWIVRMFCKNVNINKELIKSLEEAASNKIEIPAQSTDTGTTSAEVKVTEVAKDDLPKEQEEIHEEDELPTSVEKEYEITEQPNSEEVPKGEGNILENTQDKNDIQSKSVKAQQELIEIEKISPQRPPTSPSNEYKKDKTLESVIISNIISPREFYIQRQSKSLNLKKIPDLLEVAEIYEKLASPKVDEICAAISPDDGAYYRAKIISIENDSAEVFFIDYGNKTNSNDLRILPEELAILDPTAEKCGLAEIPEIDFDDNTVIEAFNSLMEIHFGEEFQIQEIDSSLTNTDEKIVKLFVQNVGVGIKLQNMLKGGNKESEIIKGFRKVFISYTNSPNDFYLQFSEDIPALEKITESLGNAMKFNDLKNPSKCDICAAKFPDDGAFYRAKILSTANEENQLNEVLFIDFGNTAYTDDLRILPDDLKDIKNMANRCTIENLSNINFDTENASEIFCSLLTEHLNETFQADIVDESTDPWIVKLFYQKRNIGGELIKSLKELSTEKGVTETWDDENGDYNTNMAKEIINNLIDNTKMWDTDNEKTANKTHEMVENLVENAEIINDLVKNVEIIDDLIENVRINSSMDEMNISDEKAVETDSNNANNTSTVNEERTTYSTEELSKELWKGYRDLGMPVSDSIINRAVSTSVIPQRNSLASSSSSSLINVHDENTRSKSSDCLHVTTEK